MNPSESMKLNVSLKATKLKNVAGAFKGKSDPFAVVTLLANNREAKPRILGKTEVIKNSLDPDWVTTFTIDYELGKPVNILVKIFDEVSKGENKSMGSAVFDIGAILGSKGSTKAKRMKDGKGTLFVRVEEVKSDGRKLKLKMSGLKLKNLDGFFNKSDPFYELMKKDHGLRGSEWNVVHRSSYIKDNLNPNWDLEYIDLGILCGGNLDEIFILSVYDHESSGKHELMGQFETSVNGLIQAKQSPGIPLMRKGKVRGTIVAHVAEVLGGHDEEEEVSVLAQSMSNVRLDPSAPPLPQPIPLNKPTFADYVRGGCEISLCVAIDFTGSNGDPRQPGSLHDIHPDGQLNDYEKAISAIGSILANFDSDKKFPVMGFGARYGGVVRHCFQCGPKEEVDGVQGILDAYRQTFQSGLTMSGPTVFTEVIETAAARAQSSQETAKKMGKQKYTILLILTDGAVSDVGATARCLDAIDESPLSIVIVGIGRANFDAMQFLDDKAGDIDIAQFVEFEKHKYNSTSLTSATLDEIPNQLERYFQRNGIMPNPPIEVEEDEIVVQAEEEEIDLSIDFSDNGNVVVGTGNGVFVPSGAY